VLTYSEIRCNKSLTDTKEIKVPISAHSALNGKYTLLRPEHTSFMGWKDLTRTSAPELLRSNLHFIRNKTLTLKMAQLALVPLLASHLRSLVRSCTNISRQFTPLLTLLCLRV